MLAREDEALVAAQSFSGASDAEPCRWIGLAASSRMSHPQIAAKQPASSRCVIGGIDVLGSRRVIEASALVVGCCGEPRGQHAGRLGASAAPQADAVVESGVALRQSRLWTNVIFT